MVYWIIEILILSHLQPAYMSKKEVALLEGQLLSNPSAI